MLAANQGHLETFQALLDHGADTTIQDLVYNITASDFARGDVKAFLDKTNKEQ